MNSFDIALANLVEQAIKEDVGNGDHSTLSCIPKDLKGKAVLKIKEEGVLAGVSVAEKIFRQLEPGSSFLYLSRMENRCLLEKLHLKLKRPYTPF